jgi:hypothetical protein
MIFGESGRVVAIMLAVPENAEAGIGCRLLRIVGL